MSVSAKFITFSKRENSTKQPNLTGATNFDIVFKQPCSMINPTITLQTSNPTAFNYCYIDIFSRYYFVQDWTSIHNGIWEASLKVDALASWKTNIGSASEYILRSASNWDGNIVDTLYPMKTETTMLVGSSGNTFDSANICYIIGILNNTDTNKYGAVKYYKMDATNLGNLMKFLLGNDILTSTQSFITGLSQELQNGIARSLMNPCDFIVESYALPYTPTVGAAETLTIGWWPTSVTGYPVLKGANGTFTDAINSGSLSLPSHPQAATRGHYLSSSPYTRYWLYLGVFGYYPVDTLQAIDSTAIDYNIYGDPFGNVRCQLSIDGRIIDTLNANVKCNFPIGQVTVDALGGASAMLNTAMSIGSGASAGDEGAQFGSIAGGAISGANGIMSAARAMLPQCRVSGSTGTFLNVFNQFISYIESHDVVDDDLTHRGRPLCQVKTISSLSGYILVGDPDISIPGTAEENVMIKNYMANGFYYE